MTNANKLNISVINLASYTKPEVIEVKNKEWVAYGKDNDYFDYLIDLYNDSTTNNAIINGMNELIYGEGLDAKDKVRKPDEYAQMKSLLKPRDLRRIIADFKMLGQCAIQVVYSKGKNKIIRWEHFPVQTLRAEKADEDGEIKAYYYSSDWKDVRPSTELKRLPAFGYGTKGELSEIMYIKPYRSGSFYYSQVDYHGALPYTELEAEIANYHINNVKHGFTPAAIINFNNGVVDDQTKFETEKKISDKFSGTSNAGKFILAFNDSKESAATIDVLSMENAHNQYQFISEEAREKIMLAHRVTSPMLLGIKDNTGLGNNADELMTASILFEKTVIKPFRVLLLEAFDELLAANDITLDLYFKSLNPSKAEIEDEVETANETKEEQIIEDKTDQTE
jgi:hypothetical protein